MVVIELVAGMMLGAAGVPKDLALGRDYDAIFSGLEAAGITLYYPTTQYQENPQTLSLGLESDFLPPPFGTADASVYEAMRAHGIRLVVAAEQLYDSDLPLPSPENDPLQALIDAAGAELIYGVYSYDEPVLRGISVAASQALYEHIKSVDPAIQVLQVQAGLGTVEGREAYLNAVIAHAQWADMVGFDVYPIGSSRGAVTPYSDGAMVSPAESIQGYMAWLQAELPEKLHAMVLQAFNIADLYSDEMLATFDPEAVAAFAAPTAQELSDMLAATDGAEAVFWWGQSHIADSSASQLWQDVLGVTLDFAASLPGTIIAGTPGADLLTGTEAAERMSGGSGDDALSGGAGGDALVGGTGADTMRGGAGDDVYYVDNAGDVVDENGASGTDVVRTNLASFNLQSANVQGSVENLIGTSGMGQALTGNALANIITGGWGGDTLSGGGGNDTLRGGGGNDNYVVNDAAVVVDEGQGSGTDTIRTSMAEFDLSQANSLGDIENLEGISAAGQILTGNALHNIISGGDGDDTVAGGGGGDTMRGGAGNDSYLITGSELADETGGSGSDEVRTALSGFDLTGPNVQGDIENLTGISDSGQDLIGNALNNVINAGAGNDTLDGGAGLDTLSGGLGDDIYFVGHRNDSVIELELSGFDTVFSLATYVLAANVENLMLSGGAAIDGSGNAAANGIRGNAAANAIDGGAGDDTLDGGAGLDTLSGGLGDDIFFVDKTNDAVIELDGSGTDTVFSTASYALAAHVEKLLLSGSAAINGTGNAADNEIQGNGAANIIDGGAGADWLQGGAGNDTYLADNPFDYIVELTGGGTDTVLSSASGFVLAANVEKGRIMSGGAADLSGNSASNILYAGAGGNILDGGGGRDTASYAYAGSAVTASLAVATAQATGGSGSDTLIGIKNLAGSNFNDVLTGNAVVNRLDGGAGDDALNGGLGSDTLKGGAGLDAFVFNTQLGSTNVDTVWSFSVAEDTIHLENTGIFSALVSGGALAAGAFNTGSAAIEADDRIIYNAATGALLYDADGTGASAAVRFATLVGVAGTLAEADFLII